MPSASASATSATITIRTDGGITLMIFVTVVAICELPPRPAELRLAAGALPPVAAIGAVAGTETLTRPLGAGAPDAPRRPVAPLTPPRARRGSPVDELCGRPTIALGV